MQQRAGVHAALRGMAGIEADIAAGERPAAQQDTCPAAAAQDQPLAAAVEPDVEQRTPEQ